MTEDLNPSPQSQSDVRQGHAAAADFEAAVERVRAWLDRGNPTGGMNLPSLDGKTPSIRADLKLVFDAFEDVRDGWSAEVRRFEELAERVARYEAPNGWRVLMARDARRVLGDPTAGVFGTVTDGMMTFAPSAESIAGSAEGTEGATTPAKHNGMPS